MPDPRITLLLRSLDQAFDQRAWHGPNLKGALRGAKPETALWRPQPERHNAWEEMVHAAYWKYRVLRYVATDPPEGFDEAGSDWFERTEGTAAQWDADRKRLRVWHARLRAAVPAFDPARLGDVAYDRYTYEDLLLGAAAHDVYHAGQIRLLRRMREATQ